MKPLLTALIILLTTQAFPQTDHNGNPVFHSVTLREDSLKNYQLSVNYYPLKNNIDDKSTAVYISAHPSLDDIEKAATGLPSDVFYVLKNRAVINMIMIRNNPKPQYLVVNPATGKQSEFPCPVRGDISENRATEIIKEGYDPKAAIKDGKLYFNNKTFTVISNNDITKNILALIDKETLYAGDTTAMKVLSPQEIRTLILTESKEGGKLDFFTPIKGHEYDGVQIKPGVITTKKEIALYQWGKAAFDLGVNTIEDALSIWAEFKGRPANMPEQETIKAGFNRAWEHE